MGAHITALLKKRQCLLLKTQLIAWKANSALNFCGLMGSEQQSP